MVKGSAYSRSHAFDGRSRVLTLPAEAVPEYTEEEYKKLKRKMDKYLLPLMWLCYGIQQTDKTSLSTQATFGLRTVSGCSFLAGWARHGCRCFRGCRC